MCVLKAVAGSSVHESQVYFTHALKPSAAAGRVPLLLAIDVQYVLISVPVIVTPPAVQDQRADDPNLPEHFTVQVYGRSPMKPAGVSVATSADGAVGVLRSPQPASAPASASSGRTVRIEPFMDAPRCCAVCSLVSRYWNGWRE